MRNGAVVVDAVVHAYNWTESNKLMPLADALNEQAYGFHCMMSREDDYRLSKDDYLRNWSVEEVETSLFAESDVDVAVYHTLPLEDFYKDGLSPLSKGMELKDRNPGRVVLYGSVNPLEGNKAIEEMEYQVKECDASGIKIYPARYYRGRTIPVQLNDPEFGIPFVESAVRLGVKSIAVHKAIPFGPTQISPYRLDDVEDVALRFPEMNFEIVHAGLAFVEDACIALARFPNIYVNLESTSGLAITIPRRFAEAIGYFLFYGGEDRIIFASGCTFIHPQPAIDALLDFEMPTDLIEDYALPPVTDEVKRKILGENFCRLHGLDAEELKKTVSADKWAGVTTEERPRPWSSVRSSQVVA